MSPKRHFWSCVKYRLRTARDNEYWQAFIFLPFLCAYIPSSLGALVQLLTDKVVWYPTTWVKFFYLNEVNPPTLKWLLKTWGWTCMMWRMTSMTAMSNSGKSAFSSTFWQLVMIIWTKNNKKKTCITFKSYPSLPYRRRSIIRWFVTGITFLGPIPCAKAKFLMICLVVIITKSNWLCLRESSVTYRQKVNELLPPIVLLQSLQNT